MSAGLQGRQVAVSSDAPLLFHPSGSVTQAFQLHEGGLQRLLRGHIDTVNACCYNPVTQVQLIPSLISHWYEQLVETCEAVSK